MPDALLACHLTVCPAYDTKRAEKVGAGPMEGCREWESNFGPKKGNQGLHLPLPTP